MVANEFTLIGKFQYYNHLYFNDLLPLPTFGIMHSYRTLGYFHCDLDEYGNIINPFIEMSDNYDYDESQFRDILIHEMIHYFLAYNKNDMKCKHGKEFKKMSKEFNLRYNMNITSTVDLSSFKIREGKSNFMFKLCTLF